MRGSADARSRQYFSYFAFLSAREPGRSCCEDVRVRHFLPYRRGYPARERPPSWSIRRLGYGLLIGLVFSGYLIWHLAKYCSARDGQLGKIGAFIICSPIFAFSAVVWRGLWGLILGLFWRAVQGA
jgi:hypothetical protein